MEDLLTMDAEEPSENSEEEKGREDYFRIFKIMEHYKDLFGLIKRKKSKEEEEEIQEYYNVSVYRVLPYPPNTKDEKDFFIQKN